MSNFVIHLSDTEILQLLLLNLCSRDVCLTESPILFRILFTIEKSGSSDAQTVQNAVDGKAPGDRRKVRVCRTFIFGLVGGETPSVGYPLGTRRHHEASYFLLLHASGGHWAGVYN